MRLASLLIAILVPSLASGDVLHVGPPGAGLPHTTIQSAVDAAAPGDTILVRTGTYGGFVVDGKSVSIVADARAQVRVEGTVQIRNLPAGGLVFVAHFWVQGGTAQPAVVVSDCVGFVRLQSCNLWGGSGPFNQGDTSQPGGAGARVESSWAVTFSQCVLSAGWGGGGLFTHSAGRGGDGLRSVDSAVALYECKLLGGSGGEVDIFGAPQPPPGGHGCWVDGWGIFASRSQMTGGTGGRGGPGHGGHGLLVEAPAQAQLLDVTLKAGDGEDGGIDGSPSAGDGLIEHHPKDSRSLSTIQLALGVPGELAAGETLAPVVVHGKPGDSVELWRSSGQSHLFLHSLSGVWSLGRNTLSGPLTGTIGASGLLVFDSLASMGHTSEPNALEHLQGIVRSPGGEVVLTNPIQRVMLECGALSPDCDSDGVFDTCQILFDPNLDSNGDSVLDACLPPATWHVDPAAPGGGDGSPAAPFTTIQAGVDAAARGDTVLLADGMYTGPGNKGISLTQSITIRSRNGPDNCVIDLEGSGRAFTLSSGSTGEMRFEGLTIERASQSAIIIKTSHLELFSSVVNCVFRDNRGSVGGALEIGLGFPNHGRAEVRGCTFLRNSATGGAGFGGGAMRIGSPSADIIDCTFEQNSGRQGGAIISLGRNLRLSGCVFTANMASVNGGAVWLRSPGQASFENCLMVGNVAPTGSVLSLNPGTTAILTSSTLVENESDFAPALYLQADSRAHISNSILWGNSSLDGSLAALAGAGAELEVAYSTFERGPAAVRRVAGTTLAWGSGNLDLDPLFVSPGDPAGPWRLSASSPCIDAGSNQLLPQDALDADGNGFHSEPIPYDLDGNPRRVDDPAVPDTGVGPGPVVDHGAYERQG